MPEVSDISHYNVQQHRDGVLITIGYWDGDEDMLRLTYDDADALAARIFAVLEDMDAALDVFDEVEEAEDMEDDDG